MISRTTLVALLLVLLIPSGMWIWLSGHRDSCSRFLAGDRTRPPSQMIEVGTEMLEIPCEQWLPRQPVGIQLSAFAEMVAVLVLAVQVAGDVRDWRSRRR